VIALLLCNPLLLISTLPLLLVLRLLLRLPQCVVPPLDVLSTSRGRLLLMRL